MHNDIHGKGKVRNGRRTFRKFLKSIKKFWFLILVAVVLAIGSALLGVFIPKILGDMTNIAVETYPEVNMNAVGEKALLVIILFVISAALNYGQAFILGVVTAKYTAVLREQILEKISRLPISYFDKHKYGDVLSRMTNDIDVLTTSLSQEIADISLSLTIVIGVIVLMLTISAPLTLISLVVVVLSILVVGKITTYAQKFFVERQNILGALNSRVEEDYAGQNIIKINSHEQTSIDEFAATNNRLTKITLKSQFLSSISMPVTHIFTNLGYVVVCIMGGFFVVDGTLSIGSIQAFVQYVSRFNRPITEIASSISVVQALLASAERIFDFLDAAEEEPDAEDTQTISNIKGAVEFHDVCFSYNEGTEVIKNFSVKVEPGQKVAIVGPTGAGKTTIINLLMRFYEPNSGYITIDGVPTREMKRSDVRKLFGMVLQDTWLFSGTVEENLRYGKNNASLEEIIAAAKVSNVNHIIEALPKAYKTEISEDSDNISAGEKQLVTIARAMVANPPMMILDEATSNVDTRTEQLIQESFEKLTSKRTSFVIAHRLSTIRNSDLILVMRDGAVVEQGNHESLLKLGGFYAELYNSQFKED